MRAIFDGRRDTRRSRILASCAAGSPRHIVWPLPAGRRRFAELEALRRGTANRSRRLARWFPPRQILVQSRGRTVTLHLTPRYQIAFVVLALLCTAGAINMLASTARHYRAAPMVAAEMDQLRRTARLESQRAQDDRELLQRLEQELSRQSVELDRAAIAFPASATLTDRKSEIERLVAERQAAIERAVAERTRIAHELDQALDDRDRLRSERDAALAANRDALSRLDAETRRAIDDMERIIAAAGLETGRLLKAPVRNRAAPRGGPFVAWPGSQVADRDVQVEEVRAVASNVGRLQALGAVLVHLPLGKPLGRLEISDGFGFRIDPVSGHAALHEGIDFVAAAGAPARATAAGTVSFVGWHGEYGNLVEVDHGMGIVTRYAHLARPLVREGETVALGQSVGLVGNSGRTTGVHLHYEIRVDGQARNPLSFLGASRHVR